MSIPPDIRIALAKKINSIVKTETDEKRIEQRINEEIAAYDRTLGDLQKKLLEPATAAVKAFMPMYKTPWYRYFITFDPLPVLKNVRVPVLALNGELDLQVRLEGKPRLDWSRSQGRRKRGHNSKSFSQA